MSQDVESFPTAAVNVGTGTAWTNPTNVFTANGINATVGFLGAGFSKELHVSGFNDITFPEGLDVLGIEFTVFCRSSVAGAITFSSVRILDDEGIFDGDELASGEVLGTTLNMTSFGAPDSLSGTLADRSYVMSGAFGVSIVVQATASATAAVDYVTARITYETEEAPPVGGYSTSVILNFGDVLDLV